LIVSGRGSDDRHRRLVQLITLALAALFVALPFSAASAGLLDLLFGRMPQTRPQLPPPVQAYAPVAPTISPVSPAHETPASTYTGRGTVFCVRLCDGRYFPVARHNGATAAQVCSSFCPASEIKVFSGGSIDHAVASDGSRYSALANAFLYRTQVLAGCTCNGRDAFGLAPVDPASDWTLRAGDIVATRSGLQAYRGRRHGANGEPNFTPIASYTGLSRELRHRLSQTKVVPTPAATAMPIDATPVAGERQAQLIR
jgi:Protein of unknown function (DUF2865)